MTIAEQLEKTLADLKAAQDQAAVAAKERDDALAAAAALTAGSAKAVADLDVCKAELAKADEAMKAEQAAHVATKAELEKAKATLANPAFVQATSEAKAEPVPEGGAVSTEARSYGELMAEYRAIADPAARAKWRAEHKDELGL